MAYGSLASFGGVALADAQDVSWDLTSGPAAPWKTLVVHEKQWSRIVALFGKPATLTFGRPEGATVSIRGLYALREVPTSKPFHRAFAVSDVRWKWIYPLYVRSMNVVMKTGKTYVVPDVGPLEIQQNAEQVTYAPWSLDPNGKQPWTARRAVEDVLEVVTGGKWRIESFPVEAGPATRSVSIQNIEFADRGEAAVRRTLLMVPGLDLRIDDGIAVAYDATRLSDSAAAVKKVSPGTTEGNIARLIALDALRPTLARVYFEREVETRWDAEEESGTTAYAEAKAGQGWNQVPEMRMRNVLSSVDVPALVIDGETFAAGSYIPIRQAVEKWGADLSDVPGAPALNMERVRRSWFVLEALYLKLGDLSATAATANWAARLSALRHHMRQTWRVDRTWMHHIRDLKPWRVGVIDPVHQIRGKAMAWSEHCKVPSVKYRVVNRTAKDKAFFWLNVEGYPGFDGALNANGAAPAAVNVLDSSAGIIRIDYSVDPYGLWAMDHPSCMRENGGQGDLIAPSLDLSRKNGPFAPQWRTRSATPMGLSDRFGACVLLTAIPGAPNGKERLHVEDVNPGELQGLLGPDFKVGGGQGPELEIYIPPGVLTAWYAWRETDAARQSARSLFGLVPGAVANSAPGYEVVNKVMLQAVARAFAAVAFSQWVNAFEGAQASTIVPGITPVGNVSGVTHRVDSDGRASTTLSLPPNRVMPDWMALIPEALRHHILGILAQGKQ
jgi:hypothetical protein